MACRPCLQKLRREAWAGSKDLRPAGVVVLPADVQADVEAAKASVRAGDLKAAVASWGRALTSWRQTVDRLPQGPDRQASLNQWGVWFREVRAIEAQLRKG